MRARVPRVCAWLRTAVVEWRCQDLGEYDDGVWLAAVARRRVALTDLMVHQIIDSCGMRLRTLVLEHRAAEADED